MMGQPGSKVQSTLASLAIIVVLGGTAVGCMGGGDDGNSEDPEGVDAGRDSSSRGHDPPDAKSDSKTTTGASAVFSKSVTAPLTFPAVSCGGAPETEALTVTNKGSTMLAVSAATVGDGFSVSPMVLQVQPGKT